MMKTYLTKNGFFETLPWFTCPRWLYHLIKTLTGATIAFGLANLFVPLVWACGIAAFSSVCLIHIIESIRGVYKFNLKDTIFDTNCSGLTFPLIAVRLYGLTSLLGWTIALGWLGIVIGLYLILLKQDWNSP